MIFVVPRYFIFLTWLIVGPSRPALATIGLVGAGIAFAILLRKSFQKRTLAILGIFGLMLVESALVLGVSVHFMLKGEPTHIMESSREFFDLLHDVNFVINLLGIVAAGCAALFIEFGKSRISLSKALPQFKFLDAPMQVREMVTQLAISAGIAVPDVCLIDSGVPSAFTVRANRRYSVTVSVGLLESLEPSEVEACLAHEIAHLKNNDFTMRFLATLAKVALFARPLSYLLEPAVYRAREFMADSTAADLVGGPDALISALSNVSESSNFESSLPSSACICNLHARTGILRVFDKHPSLEDRLRLLREMKRN